MIGPGCLGGETKARCGGRCSSLAAGDGAASLPRPGGPDPGGRPGPWPCPGAGAPRERPPVDGAGGAAAGPPSAAGTQLQTPRSTSS